MTSGNEDKCCGSCRSFEDEDAYGWGICNAKCDWQQCYDCCEEYEGAEGLPL